MDIDKYFQKLTPAERAYFIACTDLFHDTPYSVDGRPSMSKQLQNTVAYNTEVNISQASFPSLTPGSAWDLNLVSFPFLNNKLFNNTVDIGSEVDLQVPISNTVMGGITMFAADAGNPTIKTDGTMPNPKTLTIDDLIYPPGTGNTLRVFYEILAMGYEVYNVTPDLYVGGSLVRYRVPTQARKANISVSDLTAVPITEAVVNTNVLPPLPSTETLATQYPDSVIDDARSGTYQQHCIQDAVSDFHAAENAAIHISPSVVADATSPSSNAFTTRSTFTVTDEFPTLSGDFDIIGTYFSGLPSQTILKVRARYILSTVPNSTSASLTSLAKMSPPDNPKLTQLVSYVQNRLPPGVSVKLNPKGEWWKIVGRIVKQGAPVVGAEFGPVGRVVGESVAKITDVAMTSASKKKGKAAAAKPMPKPKGK